MRKRNNRIRVSNTYKRFILSFLIVLLLPVSCFVFIFLQNYREIYRDKVIGQARNSLEASAMELERTIESLESFVAYNLMSDSISEAVLLRDYGAVEVSNILSAELIAHPILESICYYNTVKPDTIYTLNGTFELKYYAQAYVSMESEEQLREELYDTQNVGWVTWDVATLTRGESEPALQYIVRSWKDECWIFFISAEKLEQIINAEHSVTILQDSDGMKLYPFRASDEGEETGAVEFDGDEEGYYEVTVASSNGDFLLTRYIDEAFLFEEIDAWQNYFFTIIFILLLVGGVLILVLTSFNEHPIRKLQSDWRNKVPDIPENVVGLEALQFAMKSMEEQVILMETKQKKNHLLLQMIYGQDCDKDYFRSSMKELGIFQHAEVYRVIVAAACEEKESGLNKLSIYLDMFPEKYYEFRIIDVSNADAAVIIVGMTEAAEKDLKDMLLWVADTIEQNVNGKIRFYVGGKYADLRKIHLSYSQALSSSQNKDDSNIDGANEERVVYYQPVRKSCGKSPYPGNELNDLYTALIETDQDKASALTERLIEILKEQSDNRLVSVSLYYDVLNVYYRAQTKLELDIEPVYLEVDLLEVQDYLDDVQMILRIRDQFQSYIDGVRESETHSSIRKTAKKAVRNVRAKNITEQDTDKNKEAHIVSKVLEYIDENSRSCDLSVSMVSDYFNMSISNLSHQFKAQTNRTISDYVTEKKFGYASELLLTTDYSVQKIAAMTGYSQTASFVRKFKQYYGTTPVEYRNTGGRLTPK